MKETDILVLAPQENTCALTMVFECGGQSEPLQGTMTRSRSFPASLFLAVIILIVDSYVVNLLTLTSKGVGVPV